MKPTFKNGELIWLADALYEILDSSDDRYSLRPMRGDANAQEKVVSCPIYWQDDMKREPALPEAKSRRGLG